MTLREGIDIANIALPFVMGIGSYVIRQAIGRQTDRISRLEVELAKNASDVKAHDAKYTAKLEAHAEAISGNAARLHGEIDDLGKDTVRREDYIREAARTRQTLERMVENQARMEGKLDIGTRVAAGIERLADQREETDSK